MPCHQLGVGDGADADEHLVALDPGAVVQPQRVHPSWAPDDAHERPAEPELDAGTLGDPAKPGSDLDTQRGGERHPRHVDHDHLDPQLPRGRGHLEADEARSHDGEPSA